MAFGFPANYQLIVSDVPAGTDLMRSVGSALSRIGWNPKAEKNTYSASTTLSMTSFGEKFTVEIMPNKSLKIRSRCSFPLQCFDLGKNKKNVDRFMQELPRHYVATGSLGSLR